MDYNSGFLVAYLAMIAGTILVSLVLYVIGAFFMSKVFAKAGVQDRWRAWVPVYNMMVFFKLGDLSPWLVLYALGGAVLLSWLGIGFLFSLALLVGSGVAAYRIGLKLQKEPAWVALWLVPIVWLGVMAFDRAQWRLNVPAAPWAQNTILGDRTAWAGVPAQVPGGGEEPHHDAGPQPEYP